MYDLNKNTFEDLIKLLDQKLNYTMGWRSTVFSQDDIEIIAYNLLELLIQRDEYRFKEISEVKPEIFEIYLKIVIDIYEGFVTLKPHPKA
tara:strand:+ start:27 stop:296 length:270 start_codon:yes stop_codon:yes gene_type:complete